jgi:hypothetical protein
MRTIVIAAVAGLSVSSGLALADTTTTTTTARDDNYCYAEGGAYSAGYAKCIAQTEQHLFCVQKSGATPARWEVRPKAATPPGLNCNPIHPTARQ